MDSKNITDFENITEQEKNDILTEMKQNYIKNIKYIGSDDKTMFSWSSTKKLKFYIILVNNNLNLHLNNLIIFAEENYKDDLVLLNRLKETSIYDFERVNEFQEKEKINQLIEFGFVSKDIKPIKNSYFSIHYDKTNFTFALKRFIEIFSKKEFENSNNKLQQKSDFKFDYNPSQYFINRFEIYKIIDGVNDLQFSEEMNQCLFAYKNECYYLTAAGLGGVVEHIMDIIIRNYGGDALEKLNKNPTASDYKNAFRRDPINIDKKQETRIDIIFRVRNSISHYSTGYSNKALVDIMLDGILHLYNEFYLPSLSYLKSNR
ncbi:hypothetical protein GSH19_05085 [Lactobacillus sp. S2-2]|uniref:hypothetical protein n=1 Tax=Lactobacillus sp. S2-2 TaxID=2692917 RepID=UPI001F2C94D7|nr:hypothetical protein [Lactobacillus sp. S2-2]MCF6515526.1 hypothetical protein [Lactobacillus sp. S2-2]